MANNIYFGNIRNLNDIRRQKRILEKKIKVRKLLMDKHLRDFEQEVTTDYVLKQTMKALKIDNGIGGLLMSFFRNAKGDKKNFIVPLFSGIGAAITSLFFYKNKKSGETRNQQEKKGNSTQYPDENQMFV